MSDPGRAVVDDDFIDAKDVAGFLQHEIEKVDDVRAEYFAGETKSADVIGRDGGCGSGANHAFGELEIGATGDDAQGGIFLMGHDGDDEIVFVGADCGDKSAGAVNAGLVEESLVGGVANDVQDVGIVRGVVLAEFLDIGEIGFDDDERSASLLEFLDCVTAGIAESTNDEVLSEFGNALLHPAPPENAADVGFDKERGERRENTVMATPTRTTNMLKTRRAGLWLVSMISA